MRMIAALLALLMTATVSEAAPLRLHKGVGLHEWLNWSPLTDEGAYRRPPYRSVEEWLSRERPLADWPEGDPFRRIRGLGFDFVRLTVDPGPLLAGGAAERREALAVLSAAVRKVTAADLAVVFNLHAVSQAPAFGMDVVNGGADSEGVAAYRDMVKDVAAMLAQIGPDKVAFEPYNEPAYYPCDASGSEDWQRIMADTVADIRSVSAALTVVATGACGGSITGLTDLDPAFDDANILYSFHMYEPHSFTHQLAEEPGSYVSGLPWPAGSGSPARVREHLSKWMRAAGVGPLKEAVALAKADDRIAAYFREGWDEAILKARLGEAVDWAGRHGIPVSRLFMGEFGVARLSADGRSGANVDDRLRYLRVLRRTAEENGIAWSVWEYSNPHGMTLIEPRGPAVADEAMLDALGLAPQ